MLKQLTVHPDLPAKAPCAQCWVLPVVLHKADIVPLGVDPQRPQAAQVQLLWVAWIRLQNNLREQWVTAVASLAFACNIAWDKTHLHLRVLLQPIWILSISAVVRPDGRLNVAHPPFFWTRHPQKGCRVHGASTNLHGQEL